MKKLISILLAVLLVASLAVTVSAYSIYDKDDPAITSEEAIKAYEAENGITVDTHRYYFQMPDGKNGPAATKDVVYVETDDETGESRDILVCKEGEKAPSWYNDFTEGAGIYWWGSAPASCDTWAGYAPLVEDAEHSIFYADVPSQAVVFVWNNGVDGGMDKTQEIYYKAAQTIDVPSEYPDLGEWPGILEAADSFNNCIFIINPDDVNVNALSKKMTCGGSWYFYYGNGCYGTYPETSKDFTDIEHNCVNPDHYENGDITGTHIGFAQDEPQPTYKRGDYDGDEKITIMDATRVQNIIAELVARPEEAFLAGVDADGDGMVTIMDATRIQNVVAELMNMDGSTPFVAA